MSREAAEMSVRQPRVRRLGNRALVAQVDDTLVNLVVASLCSGFNMVLKRGCDGVGLQEASECKCESQLEACGGPTSSSSMSSSSSLSMSLPCAEGCWSRASKSQRSCNTSESKAPHHPRPPHLHPCPLLHPCPSSAWIFSPACRTGSCNARMCQESSKNFEHTLLQVARPSSCTLSAAHSRRANSRPPDL